MEWFASIEYSLLYLCQFEDWTEHPCIVELMGWKHPNMFKELVARARIRKIRIERRQRSSMNKRIRRLNRVEAQAIPGLGLF